MGIYTVREAKPEEQRELTRLCVRATMHSGYDEEFIDRSMPSLTITLPEISGDFVRVVQDDLYEVVGVVCVMPTALQGIALLHGLFVDPARWKRGIGRILSGAAVARAKGMKAGAIMIYANPSAEGFYKRMGAIRIGEGPFCFSPGNRIASPPVYHSFRGLMCNNGRSLVCLWPTAAPDVCDGTSAVGESRHRIPRRIRWSTD